MSAQPTSRSASSHACAQRRQASAQIRQCSWCPAWRWHSSPHTWQAAAHVCSIWRRIGSFGAGPPRGKSAGGGTDVRAVEIEPDALLQLLDHLLGEAGIGAGGASLSAGVAFVDAADQRLADAAPHVGMRADNLSRMHGNLLAERVGRSEREALGTDRNE